MQSGATDRRPKRSSAKHRQATQIDTTVDIVTPENIAFKYQVAGPFRRLCAFLVDAAAIVGGLILLGLLGMLLLFGVAALLMRLFGPGVTQNVMQVLFSVTAAAYLVIWFTSYWFYGGLFETYWSGQTPGKWMLGLRTLSTNGQPINGLQAVLRNILRAVDAFPLLSPAIFAGTFVEQDFFGGTADSSASLGETSRYVVYPTFMLGLLSMVLTKRFQRIGDLVCDTMVVMEERSWLMGVARLEDPRTPDLAALLPPKLQISRSMMLALATYVERRRFFSLARRREIARHLAEPLLRRFGMPEDTSHDLLLCALYYRAFVTESNGDDQQAMTAAEQTRRPALPHQKVPHQTALGASDRESKAAGTSATISSTQESSTRESSTRESSDRGSGPSGESDGGRQIVTPK